MDTTLRLDYPGMSNLYLSGSKRKFSVVDGAAGSANDILLMLALGHSQSSSESSKISMGTSLTMSLAKETDEGIQSGLGLGIDLNSSHGPFFKKPTLTKEKAPRKAVPCDLQLSLFSGPSASIITDSSFHQLESSLETSASALPTVERSTSSNWNSGVASHTSFLETQTSSSFLIDWKKPNVVGSDSTSRANMPAHSALKSSVTNSFGVTHVKPQRSSSLKGCKFEGCTKGARGASGLCIAHGGGRRCQREGCNKGAEGRTVYCKAHGGGRRCHFLGCTKSAEGRTDYCIAHGGGRRCSHEGCTRAARGKSGLCIRHGGGKRCQKENCTKSAEGYSGFCIAHGGGRRCQFTGCTKGAQGSTFYCKAHGGGKRCTAPGCTKGAEGSTPFCKGHGGGKRCSFQGGGVCPKSVHGGTMFCVAHGGGKRCAAPDCTRSARGRTNFCVRHGGGKRCKAEGCSKSAQGRTDFCKAHGGGTRCSWGQEGSAHGFGEPPCDHFARGRTGLCTSHSAMVLSSQAPGNATTSLQMGVLNKTKVVGVKGPFESMGQQRSAFVGWDVITKQFGSKAVPLQSEPFALPEGRVHGGKLMEMLSGGEGLRSLSGAHLDVGPSNAEALRFGALRNWI